MTASKRATTRNNKTTTEEVSSPPPHKEKVRASPGSAENKSKKTKKSEADLTITLPGFIGDKITKQSDDLKIGQSFMIYLNSLMRDNEVNTNYQISLKYGDIYLLGYMASLKSMTTESYIKSLIEKDIRENFKANFIQSFKELKEAKA